MSVRTRLVGASVVAGCLAFAGYSGFAAAKKTKAPIRKATVSAGSASTARPEIAAPPRSSARPQTNPPRKALPPARLLNLNTATVADLDALPSIGLKTAQRIIEYRQKIGGFKKIEQLMNVRGVGEKNFLKLKDRITVGPRTAASGGSQQT
jgi:competence ComEA-like helix-hairpin-helix protein